MIVLHRNHDQLVIGADTRKIALLMVGAFTLVCIGMYSLLQNSQILPRETVRPVSIGLISFLSLFVLYYVYHVFRQVHYTFDKRDQSLMIQTTSLLGSKQKTYALTDIKRIEMRQTPTYAYATGIETHATDAFMHTRYGEYYNQVVLHLPHKKELPLSPNAAYFFLHPFSHLTEEIDNGLGKQIAEFLDIPLVEKKITV
jgi:hypothetical protein